MSGRRYPCGMVTWLEHPVRFILAVGCSGLALAAWQALPAVAAFPGANGRIAFETERGTLDDPEIFSSAADGSDPINLTNLEPGEDENPAWSPDGTRIAFQSFRDDNGEIYVMNADGSGATNLTENAGTDTQPSFSPDGSKIVFSSDRSNISSEIFVMNADGTGQTPLTSNTAPEGQASFSPDGSKILFGSSRDGNNEIYVMNPDGTGQTRLTNNTSSDQDPSFSPNGQQIVFASTRDGNLEIYRMDADGSNPLRLTNNSASDLQPTWSPDGQKIAFSSSRAGSPEIFAMNADGTSPVNLTNDDGADRNPDWQRLDSDTDGDALPDSWEEDGIDVDGDGTPELDLPAMGADPDHKDIFAEVDFMAGHRIDDANIDAVTTAFAAAPVSNPDGQPGINLHVDNGPGSTMDPVSGATWGSLSDQDTLTHQETLGSQFTTSEGTFYDWSEFETRRQTNLLTVRRPAFHYVMAAHSGPAQKFSGKSRGVEASDFIMAMHENCLSSPPIGTECTQDPEYTAATFMHELGHNLGLQHGGTDEDARKPNYMSVMNYNFGFGLILTNGGFELDYSRFNLALNEGSLDEEIGFGITSGPLTALQTILRCPNGSGGFTKYRIPLTAQHTDWNCDRSITGIGNVSHDVSGDGAVGQLTGPIDWNRLVFDGGGIGALNEPPPVDQTVIDEPTPEELHENREVLESGTAPPINPVSPVAPKDETPPQSEFGKKPKNKLKAKRATYTFSSDEDGSTFECRLDRKPFKACSSPVKLKRLKKGKHSFEVRAIDAAGNVDPSPAKDRFKVVR